MGPLAAIIVIELILSASILGLASHPQTLNKTKHKIANVLGIQKIAQVDDSTNAPADNSSTDTSSQPTDNTTPPAPSDSTTSNPQSAAPTPPGSTEPSSNQSSPPEQSNPPPTTTSQDSTAPTDNQSLFENEINSSTPTTDQGSPSNNQSGELTPKTSTEEITQTQAVLNPDDLVNSPENINSQSLIESKKEDDQISKITDPKEQTLTLITFATDRVKDMSNFTKADDFSSTNFAAQRFNSQIDQAIANLEKLPKQDQAKLKQQLINFCSQADQVLRTVELSVPQESEQDIQIARGQCQELQL